MKCFIKIQSQDSVRDRPFNKVILYVLSLVYKVATPGSPLFSRCHSKIRPIRNINIKYEGTRDAI